MHCVYATTNAVGGFLRAKQAPSRLLCWGRHSPRRVPPNGKSIHYASWGSPLCGREVVDSMCIYEPEAVAGYASCLELVVEDMTVTDTHQDTCLQSGKKISARGGVKW